VLKELFALIGGKRTRPLIRFSGQTPLFTMPVSAADNCFRDAESCARYLTRFSRALRLYNAVQYGIDPLLVIRLIMLKFAMADEHVG